MFREICSLISTLTGFVIGSTLQAGRYAQNAPVRCVLVQESGGATNFDCPDMVDAGIQILSRSASYTEARADAWTAFRSLHGTAGWEMPRLDGASGDENYLVATVEALAAPQYLGEDDNRRHLFSVNFIFRVQDGSCSETAPDA